ncbi:nitrous oxide reductase accessory protein NosL [Lysinibacillus sp. KU-BSD001]|uniref:nitrous oxide reductase accessory protein NosL n=1 Tax=Lysinibacillus sp. KU-BSD001 TaxID=3141328 RepID=UPI0036F018BF
MKWKWFILMAVLLLVGCSEKAYEPKEVNPETDICKVCNMSIAHEDYAAQLVFKNGDYEMFDDIGCLMEFLEGTEESEVGAMFMKDMTDNEWVDVKTATYIYSKDYWTPMNYGVLAFKTKEEAEQYMASEGDGELLAFDDLKTFNWGVHH